MYFSSKKYPLKLKIFIYPFKYIAKIILRSTWKLHAKNFNRFSFCHHALRVIKMCRGEIFREQKKSEISREKINAHV